jgi:hypothetical protein
MCRRTGTLTSRLRCVGAALVSLVAAVAACDEDPFTYRWNATPDTVRLYSLARPEPNLASGFGFSTRLTVQVETPDATGTWDVALDTEGGSLVLKPPGALGITARAALVPMGAVAFDDVDEAPGNEALYVLDDPVPLTPGHVYVVRTNRQVGSFGSTCVYYGKLQPLVVNVAAGELDFHFVISGICNSRSLVPPD